MKEPVQFPKSDLLDLLCDEPPDGYEMVEDQLVDTTRWSKVYRLTFKYGGKLYQTGYSTGATEHQDEGPFENDGKIIDCYEVEAVEVKVVKYKRI